LAWGDCGKFWGQALRSLIRPKNSDGLTVATQVVGDQWRLAIQKRDLNGLPESKVAWEMAVIDNEGDIQLGQVQEIGLGRYQASIPVADRVSTSVRLRDPAADQVQIVHYHRPWPAEYRLSNERPAFLRDAVALVPSQMRENLIPQPSRVSVAHYFYLMAILLVLLSNLLRRL
jgi:Ca-activated chloride channel homolog